MSEDSAEFAEQQAAFDWIVGFVSLTKTQDGELRFTGHDAKKLRRKIALEIVSDKREILDANFGSHSLTVNEALRPLRKNPYSGSNTTALALNLQLALESKKYENIAYSTNRKDQWIKRGLLFLQAAMDREGKYGIKSLKDAENLVRNIPDHGENILTAEEKERLQKSHPKVGGD